MNTKQGSDDANLVVQGCQGDVGIFRVAEVPSGYTRNPKESGEVIIAHSETGHHHVVDVSDVVVYDGGPDPLRAYLVLNDGQTEVTHKRGYDTHGTITLLGGIGAVYEVYRQREYDPIGERRAAD